MLVKQLLPFLPSKKSKYLDMNIGLEHLLKLLKEEEGWEMGDTRKTLHLHWAYYSALEGRYLIFTLAFSF